MSKPVFKECCVIGCGISGIALARWLKKYSIDFVVFEKSNDLGGLWRFQPDGYGVMNFTHINVSKYNYHFSDFPFPDEQVEFMHHQHIYNYAKSYMEHFKLFEHVKFNNDVVFVEEVSSDDPIRSSLPKFEHVKATNKLWKLRVKAANEADEQVYVTPFVGVCTGHHGTPRMASFKGQETFPGEIIHSVKYKSAKMNKMEGKKVLLVGVGNSSVDAADNLVTEGNCPKVIISSRSGAWVFPNYISGVPSELYVNRFKLALPWKIKTYFQEELIKFLEGNPKKYNLNPKHRALESHPTVSPTLYHHIQRGRVKIEPNIKEIAGSEVVFENGMREVFDSIILCTGYRIMLDFLHPNIKNIVFADKEELYLDLFKMVFSPEIGHTMSFIGFVQPHTGGILAMSEIQSRWFVYLMTGQISLPTKEEMKQQIREHRNMMDQRFYKSARHTMQEDPLTYNDDIAKYFGAKPDLLRNLPFAWRILFSSCGAAQWRLNGIDSMPNAAQLMKSVPVPPMAYIETFIVLFFLVLLFLVLVSHPLMIRLVSLPYVAYKMFVSSNEKN